MSKTDQVGGGRKRHRTPVYWSIATANQVISLKFLKVLQASSGSERGKTMT
jgi:hypothetical protein